VSELRFDDRVVVVTGAGNGLGRAHAHLFASRGAKVVVNDLGGDIHGGGGSAKAADVVVDEIKAAGGEAVANYDSVTDGEKIIQTAMDTWGRIDVVVNNAGILRDVSFHKMTEEDWDLVYQVHVKGSFAVTHAAWPHMREAQYGRVIMTASAAGIYGNFGQANYAMAKLGLFGFGQTLAIEGRKRNIHVNTIAPIAGSRMTETVLPENLLAALKPEYVSPLVAWLASEECEATGGLYEVGGGFFAGLRWERAKGKTFRVGRDISPEDVRANWDVIDGGEAEHPASITESMQPVMQNLEKGESKGGSDWIDVDEALGYEFPEQTSSYDERDLALYALGVGAAKDGTGELDLVYEMAQDGFKALPSYGVIPAINVILDLGKRGVTAPGLSYGLDRVLHGEQRLELKRPLPKNATLTHKARISDIFDKGKGALVVTTIESFDEDGDLLAVNEVTTFVRGAGGWGGERGPSSDKNTPPDRKPDVVVEEKTAPNQALLYRLSGDWNPLHADPAFAKAMSFDRPILHGLCTFGFSVRHVLSELAPDGDPRYFKSVDVRFAKTVYPGETLITEAWKEGDKLIFQTKVKERDEVCLSNGAIELYETIPKKKAKPEKAAAKAEAAPSGPIAADIFHAIGLWMEENAEDTKKVDKVFQFVLTEPDAVWTVDCKNTSVAEGLAAKPDCTLTLTDANFLAMCTGKADPQKLYFGGDLQIGGDIMASQKLTFLQKVEERHVKQAMDARGDGGAVPPTDAAPSNEPTSADIFRGIGIWMGENPDVQQVGKVFQFKLSDPDAVWTIDAKGDTGVTAGETLKPDCTLELTDADFIAMTKGEKDAQKMYFGGELKVGGDIMASQKLTFLQKVEETHVLQAMESRPAGGEKKAALKKAAKEPFAPTLMGSLTVKSGGAGTVQIRVTDPDGAWFVDLGEGSVKPGTYEGADTTLTLDDESLAELAKGDADAEALFLRGKLRVDGDITPARNLDWLKA
jgi:3-hydroxyacyl-CoA dehydrogenase/3a,7a,12a-trihydroxy-5b-cholest-24-enoyl-CoA hydratase